MSTGSISLPMAHAGEEDRFGAYLRSVGWSGLEARTLSTLQVNLGRKCNQACHHCHVDAGPNRTEEMSLDTVEAVLAVLQRQRFWTLDITGGAPEINAHFRTLASRGAELCDRVIDRSNLTIFFEAGHEDLPEFLASRSIEVCASLPCYLADNVDRQRGQGVFDSSVRALQRLNRLGYGRAGSGLVLNLVYNPVGPTLPPAQCELERQYRTQLRERFGIEFNQLFTITNMPINRFRHDLQRSGQYATYMASLREAFNPCAVEQVMCRDLLSVGWDGTLYDCDFNQMLEMSVEAGAPQHIRDFDLERLQNRRIRTAEHCFGCTAGDGSSCQGAVVVDERPFRVQRSSG